MVSRMEARTCRKDKGRATRGLNAPRCSARTLVAIFQIPEEKGASYRAPSCCAVLSLTGEERVTLWGPMSELFAIAGDKVDPFG